MTRAYSSPSLRLSEKCVSLAPDTVCLWTLLLKLQLWFLQIKASVAKVDMAGRERERQRERKRTDELCTTYDSGAMVLPPHLHPVLGYYHLLLPVYFKLITHVI